MTKAPTEFQAALGFAVRYGLALPLVLALLLTAADALADDGADADRGSAPSLMALGVDCAGGDAAVADEPWIRTELFFGTAGPDGTEVTEAEWNGFLDEEITPRFPDGLTVQTGLGQWRDGDGAIVQERSMVVILLYPRAAEAESGAEIEEIRSAYEAVFQQESVLRSDDSRPVCVSF